MRHYSLEVLEWMVERLAKARTLEDAQIGRMDPVFGRRLVAPNEDVDGNDLRLLCELPPAWCRMGAIER